jgi:hypothetical protein
VSNQPSLRRLPLAVAVAAIGTIGGCGGSSNGSPASQSQGTSVIVTCGDAGYTVSEIHYTSWEKARAKGSGVALVTHGEHPGRYPVKFSLGRPTTFHGVRLFAALEVKYIEGQGPAGDKKEAFDLSTNWYTSDLS